jgi:hypothetical protein
MLFVTFHGGKQPKSATRTTSAPNEDSSLTPINNVYAYGDEGGSPLETKVLRGADEHLKDGELRGMVFYDKHLYVLNGRKNANQILRFKGSGTKYEFKNVFASREGSSRHEGINSLYHPFAFALSGKKYCFVSNQDTNVVTRLKLDHHQAKTASAASVASSLKGKGTYFDGTFVACSQGQLPGLTPTTPEPLPQGLGVFIDPKLEKVHFSVRDILISGRLLYVCDEPAGVIKVYDTDGNLVHFSNPVPRPAHLLVQKKNLYVSGGDQVLLTKLDKFPLYFTPANGVIGKDASGMAFNAAGSHFFVADRKMSSVYRYDVNRDGAFGNRTAVIKNMPDHPEFLLYINH